MSIPSSPPPSPSPSPNYKKTAGRLVVDRFDFQNHIDGYSFRQKASTIDLAAPTTINSVVTYNLQQAIDQIVILTFPLVIPDASSSVKGLIKLSGDLSGTASSVIVSGIQNRPISAISPTGGDILTWDGSTNLWKPAAPSNVFSAGGDLAGSNTSQTVSSLTGVSGTVSVSANSIQFSSASTTPILSQSNASSGNGADLFIQAQTSIDSSVGSHKGGDLILRGGDSVSSALGGVKIAFPSGTILQMSQISGPSSRVLSLFNLSDVSTSQMPSGTGDRVMYVANTSTPPTSGNPINGTIVYSSGGQLWVKQSNGDNFSVGSSSNPSVWGPIEEQVYTYRKMVNASAGTPTDALVFTIPDFTVIKAEVVVVAKRIGATSSSNYNLTMAYYREAGSAPQPIGSTVSTDSKLYPPSGFWGTPTITVSGNDLKVTTGTCLAGTINWLFVIKLYLSKA